MRSSGGGRKLKGPIKKQRNKNEKKRKQKSRTGNGGCSCDGGGPPAQQPLNNRVRRAPFNVISPYNLRIVSSYVGNVTFFFGQLGNAT